MSDEVAGIVGLDVCPYCFGTDQGKPEYHEDGHGQLKVMECENCGRYWVVALRPTAFVDYDLELGHSIRPLIDTPSSLPDLLEDEDWRDSFPARTS